MFLDLSLHASAPEPARAELGHRKDARRRDRRMPPEGGRRGTRQRRGGRPRGAGGIQAVGVTCIGSTGAWCAPAVGILSALGSRLSALGSRLSALGSLSSVAHSAPESPPSAGLNGSLRPALNPPTVSCVNVPEAVSSRPSAAASLRRVPRSVPELSAPEIVRVDAICRLPPCHSPAPLAGGRSSRGTARSRESSARIKQSNGAATCQRPLEHWSYDGGAYLP